MGQELVPVLDVLGVLLRLGLIVGIDQAECGQCPGRGINSKLVGRHQVRHEPR